MKWSTTTTITATTSSFHQVIINNNTVRARSFRENALVVTIQGEIPVCGATCERHNGRQPVRNMHHHIADSASHRRREHGTVDETSDTRAALPDERFVASKRVIPRDPAGILPNLVVHVVSGRWRTVVTAWG